MVEFFTATEPTARKQHICDLCGRPINVGEKYSRFEGKADGEMFCTKNHLFCADVIERYCQWAGENEYDIDSANEWAEGVAWGNCQHSQWADDDCGKSFWDCEIARKALEDCDGQR
jgi:hypothetical protein